MTLRTIIFLFSTHCLFITLYAQEMVTDRPDFTESALVATNFMIGAGFSFQFGY